MEKLFVKWTTCLKVFNGSQYIYSTITWVPAAPQCAGPPTGSKIFVAWWCYIQVSLNHIIILDKGLLPNLVSNHYLNYNSSSLYMNHSCIMTTMMIVLNNIPKIFSQNSGSNSQKTKNLKATIWWVKLRNDTNVIMSLPLSLLWYHCHIIRQHVTQLDTLMSLLFHVVDMFIHGILHGCQLYNSMVLWVELPTGYINSSPPWTKWLPFCRRHFQTHFDERKSFLFRVEFHWSLLPRVQLTIRQH